MRFTKISFLLVLLAGFAACGGNNSKKIVGSWKVVDLVLSPDSLNHSDQFDKSQYTKLRFTFNADSTMEISDGTTPGDKARYSLEDSGSQHYLVFRPLLAQENAMQGVPQSQRLRIVQLTSNKLDLEQKFDQITVTTKLESLRQ